MKQIKRVIIAIVVGITMCISIAVSADQLAPITFEVSNGVAKQGETVAIPVNVNSETGVAGIVLRFDYDKDALTLERVEESDVFPGGLMTSLTSNSTLWLQSRGDNNEENGLFCTLHFKVNDNAKSAIYDIKIGEGSQAAHQSLDGGNDPKGMDLVIINGKIAVKQKDTAETNAPEVDEVEKPEDIPRESETVKAEDITQGLGDIVEEFQDEIIGTTESTQGEDASNKDDDNDDENKDDDKETSKPQATTEYEDDGNFVSDNIVLIIVGSVLAVLLVIGIILAAVKNKGNKK